MPLVPEEDFDPTQPKVSVGPDDVATAPALPAPAAQPATSMLRDELIDPRPKYWLAVKLADPVAHHGNTWFWSTFHAPSPNFPTLESLREHRAALADAGTIVFSRLCERPDDFSLMPHDADFRVLEERPHRPRRKAATPAPTE